MRFIILPFILFISIGALAQKDSIQSTIGIKLFSGQTFIHTQAVKNVTGAKPYGFEIELAKHQTNFASFNLSGAYVKSGWALSYFNYNTSILGYGIIASRFIEPHYRISNKLQFSIKASVGAAYLSNPNDAIKNPTNRNYSSHLNPYLHIASGLNLQVAKHTTIGLQSSFHHISNGNLQRPNAGINWITGALSINYYPGNNTLPKYKSIPNNFWKNKKTDIQLGLFFVPQQGYYDRWMAQRKYLLGAFTQATKQIGRTSAVTAGAEIYYNNFKQDANAKPIASGVVAGLQAGHVFILGKVNFSQQIGYSFYNKIDFLPSFYHRWGLDYSIGKHYTIGANLKANSDNADFFDFRIAYKF